MFSPIKWHIFLYEKEKLFSSEKWNDNSKCFQTSLRSEKKYLQYVNAHFQCEKESNMLRVKVSLLIKLKAYKVIYHFTLSTIIIHRNDWIEYTQWYAPKSTYDYWVRIMKPE
jgi:hypothetical protein